mmetsp:Transcript_7737/g.13472  ORF Transcript_7737/g.13472 Transcript_7737/m.13472 type:complete len:189 (+) Transcript_7737:80-646(+)
MHRQPAINNMFPSESGGMPNSRGFPPMFPPLDGAFFDLSNDTSIELNKSWLKPRKHSVRPKEKPSSSSPEGPDDAAGELIVPFTTQTDFLLNENSFSTPISRVRVPISSHYLRTSKRSRSDLPSFPALPPIATNAPTGNCRAPPFVTLMPRVPRRRFRSPTGVDADVEWINFEDEANDNDASSRFESS